MLNKVLNCAWRWKLLGDWAVLRLVVGAREGDKTLAIDEAKEVT